MVCKIISVSIKIESTIHHSSIFVSMGIEHIDYDIRNTIFISCIFLSKFFDLSTNQKSIKHNTYTHCSQWIITYWHFIVSVRIKKPHQNLLGRFIAKKKNRHQNEIKHNATPLLPYNVWSNKQKLLNTMRSIYNYWSRL